MKRHALPGSGLTRRGLIAGAALIAAPFVVRSRAEDIEPVAVPEDRAFPRSDLLISPRTLYQRIVVDRRPLRLLDASDLATFRARHLPGAAHVWWQDTMELNAPYYGMVLKPDDGAGDQGRRIRFLERLGIAAEDEVVVYGNKNDASAARVCWFLRFLGMPASLLDGGRAGWLGISGPITGDATEIDETTNPAVRPQQDFYLFASEIAGRLGNPGVQLLDLRNADERIDGSSAGKQIAGAIDLPRDSLLTGLGLIQPPNELDRIITEAGIDLTATLMLVAPTGVEAATAWLALSLMGAGTVIVSDGGWQEWIDTPGLPVGPVASVGPVRPNRLG